MSKNVENLGRASIKGKIIVGKVWRTKLEVEKAWEFCKCVMVNSKLMEYLIVAP